MIIDFIIVSILIKILIWFEKWATPLSNWTQLKTIARARKVSRLLVTKAMPFMRMVGSNQRRSSSINSLNLSNRCSSMWSRHRLAKALETSLIVKRAPVTISFTLTQRIPPCFYRNRLLQHIIISNFSRGLRATIHPRHTLPCFRMLTDFKHSSLMACLARQHVLPFQENFKEFFWTSAKEPCQRGPPHASLPRNRCKVQERALCPRASTKGLARVKPQEHSVHLSRR